MIGGLLSWRQERKSRRLERVVADAEGIREGREVWETKRYNNWGPFARTGQPGAGGTGRRTTRDEGKTKDDWS